MERDPEAYVAFVEAMRSEEGALLAAALDGGDGRARYAAWLRARGDRRGDALALALELELDAQDAPDPRRQDALRALVAQIPAGWWRLVRSRRVQLNCGAAGAVAPTVRFGFICPRSWEELATTERAGVRACDACRQPVYRCDTAAEADARARRGDCVSVPARLVELHADTRTMIVGRPEPALARWARALFGEPTER
ncbi:MAG: hypothetical protein JNK64_34665 [Myxococcales bacterium]|nr:hypothetical protein [Myxococcales bacterium]